MKGRPTEEFRYSRSGAVLLGIGAALLLTSVGLLLPGAPWPNGLPVVVSVILGILTACGLALGWVAVRRYRARILIGPDGAQFARQEHPFPWARIGGIRSRTFGTGVEVFDHDGVTIGILPVELEEFGRAILLISERIPASGDPRIGLQLQGSHGSAGWLLFVLAVLFVFREFNFSRARDLGVVPWIIVGAMFLGVMAKTLAMWRQTGRFEVTVDASGVRFTGRSQAWELRWGEIRDIALRFNGIDQMMSPRIALILDGGKSRDLPVRGVDIQPLLLALRTFGGPAAAALTPPVGRPNVPLLKRSI